MKKILHITVKKHISNGIYTQLKAEQNSKVKTFSTIVVSNDSFDLDNTIKIPKLFDNFIGLRVLLTYYLFKYNGEYDVIIYRKLPLNFLSFFYPIFSNNAFPVYHSKLVEEIKLNNNLLTFLIRNIEHLLTVFESKFVDSIFAVTDDILNDYDIKYKFTGNLYVYHNGIDFNVVPLAQDQRSISCVHVCFMCGKFCYWHGLDKLLSLLINDIDSVYKKSMVFHLVGQIPEEYLSQINILIDHGWNLKVYGYLDDKDVLNVLSLCDIALDSLALERKNLTTSTALKNRFYLASGLPIFSPFLDDALPIDFKYFVNNVFNLSNIFNAGITSKSFNKIDVRLASESYLSKFNIILRLLKKIN